MTTYQERFNYALEIEKLKTRLKDLETKLREEQEREFNDPLRTFEVVLRVETRASTWGAGVLDKNTIYHHFDDFTPEIAETINLIDEGDSIKVQRVIEVTINDNNT
jgi:hypothetical protein